MGRAAAAELTLFEALAWVGVLILALIFAAAHVPALSILLYVATAIGSILVGLSLTVRRGERLERSLDRSENLRAVLLADLSHEA